MALAPQKLREMILQLLFSQTFPPSEGEETALWLMEELKVSKKAALEALAQVKRVIEHLPEIDEKIGAHSTEYTFERISGVEKAALRLAFFEFLFESAIPRKVIFSEAIRLTRKFASPEGAHFVSALLSAAFPEPALV